MPPVAPPDLPALFPIGFHRLTMENVEQVCVDQFSLSSTRPIICDGLDMLVTVLELCDVVGELWVDGSFLTEKINPKDVDVVLRVDGALYNSGTAKQRNAIDWVIDNQKLMLKCDSYAFFEYPPGDPLHDEGRWWYSYWHKQWGFSREDDPKGIVVLAVGVGGTP
jgi:hypothetical protein